MAKKKASKKTKASKKAAKKTQHRPAPAVNANPATSRLDIMLQNVISDNAALQLPNADYFDPAQSAIVNESVPELGRRLYAALNHYDSGVAQQVADAINKIRNGQNADLAGFYRSLTRDAYNIAGLVDGISGAYAAKAKNLQGKYNQADADKQAAEQARDQYKGERDQAKQDYAQADAARAQAEQDKQAAEGKYNQEKAARQAAEQARQQADAAYNQEKAARQQADADKQAAEAAKQSAEGKYNNLDKLLGDALTASQNWQRPNDILTADQVKKLIR